MLEVGHNKEVCAIFVSFCMKPFIFKFKFVKPIFVVLTHNLNPCHNSSHAFLSWIPGMPKTSNLLKNKIKFNQKKEI